jgi:hypothetical protein
MRMYPHIVQKYAERNRAALRRESRAQADVAKAKAMLVEETARSDADVSTFILDQQCWFRWHMCMMERILFGCATAKIPDCRNSMCVNERDSNQFLKLSTCMWSAQTTYVTHICSNYQVGEAEEARHDVQEAERKHAQLEKILDEVTS